MNPKTQFLIVLFLVGVVASIALYALKNDVGAPTRVTVPDSFELPLTTSTVQIRYTK